MIVILRISLLQFNNQISFSLKLSYYFTQAINLFKNQILYIWFVNTSIVTGTDTGWFRVSLDTQYVL